MQLRLQPSGEPLTFPLGSAGAWPLSLAMPGAFALCGGPGPAALFDEHPARQSPGVGTHTSHLPGVGGGGLRTVDPVCHWLGGVLLLLLPFSEEQEQSVFGPRKNFRSPQSRSVSAEMVDKARGGAPTCRQLGAVLIRLTAALRTASCGARTPPVQPSKYSARIDSLCLPAKPCS